MLSLCQATWWNHDCLWGKKHTLLHCCCWTSHQIQHRESSSPWGALVEGWQCGKVCELALALVMLRLHTLECFDNMTVFFHGGKWRLLILTERKMFHFHSSNMTEIWKMLFNVWYLEVKRTIHVWLRLLLQLTTTAESYKESKHIQSRNAVFSTTTK